MSKLLIELPWDAGPLPQEAPAPRLIKAPATRETAAMAHTMTAPVGRSSREETTIPTRNESCPGQVSGDQPVRSTQAPGGQRRQDQAGKHQVNANNLHRCRDGKCKRDVKSEPADPLAGGKPHGQQNGVKRCDRNQRFARWSIESARPAGLSGIPRHADFRPATGCCRWRPARKASRSTLPGYRANTSPSS